MANPFQALDTNGIGDIARTLAARQGCVERLSRLSAVSATMSRVRQTSGLGLASLRPSPANPLRDSARALETSPTGMLLRSLPFSASYLQSLTQLSLLAASLMNIRRTLGVDLLQPNA